MAQVRALVRELVLEKLLAGLPTATTTSTASTMPVGPMKTLDFEDGVSSLG